MAIKVLNEFLPPAETENLGAIKVGDTLDIDESNVLNVDDSATIKPYMTNCMVRMSQDLNFTLVDHVLTLKSGSVLYVPNGITSDIPTFTKVTVASDIELTQNPDLTGKVFVCYTGGGSIVTETLSNKSGTTFPSDPLEAEKFYKRDENRMYRYNGTEWLANNESIPLALITVAAGVPQSLDMVFNGMSYFGNVAFVLPGVIGLASNGKTADGNFINTDTIVDKVLVSADSTYLGDHILAITPGGVTRGRCFVVPVDTYTTSLYPPSTVRWYNPDENKYYIFSSGIWNNDPQAHIATMYKSTADKIENFTPGMVFRSADYNELRKELNDLHIYKMDRAEIQYVSAVPANPQEGVIYLIAQ